jgi:hypothetical protein
MTIPVSRNVPLVAVTGHRPVVRSPQDRKSYVLARRRAARTREPPPRFAHLTESHD